MAALNNGEKWLTSAHRVSNFTLKETECKCGCGFNDVHQPLIDTLQSIREFIGLPVYINSCCRCDTYNKSIKGASNSMHVCGMAADIAVKDFNGAWIASEALFEIIRFLPIPVIIKYPEQHFVHIDVRNATLRMALVKGVYIPIV